MVPAKVCFGYFGASMQEYTQQRMPGVARTQARLVLPRSSADFWTTPGLIFFYSISGSDFSDMA